MSILKKFDAYAFTIQTERVSLEGVQYFKASVYELPNVEVYEKSAAQAYKVIIESIEDLHLAAVEDGRSFPSPEKREQTEYSGRVTLRMSKDLHQRIDLQAKRNGNTLNAEIVNQLSQTSSIQEMAHHLSTGILNNINTPRHPTTSLGIVPTTDKVVLVSYATTSSPFAATNYPAHVLEMGHPYPSIEQEMEKHLYKPQSTFGKSLTLVMGEAL